MKKYFTAFLALCLIGGVNYKALGQDIHFSQFYENSILRNPALTGIFSGDYKAGINYRTQWSNISVPFQTALASAETRILVNSEVGDYLSFGIAATYDRAGTINFNSYQVYGSINYNKSLEDVHYSYLSVGFAGGYLERSIDMNKMTFSSQYINGFNASNPTGETMSFRGVNNYDLAAGISLNSSLGQYNNINYYVGAAAYHINQPVETFNNQYNFIRLQMKWSGNFGMKFNIDPQYAITMHFNYTDQSPYQEWIGGGLVSWKSIAATDGRNFTVYGGLFYRLNDAIIPTVKLDYQNYSITCSYDINNSSLKTATNGAGGFEISLYARGNYKKTKRVTDETQCPRFENLNNNFQD